MITGPAGHIIFLYYDFHKNLKRLELSIGVSIGNIFISSFKIFCGPRVDTRSRKEERNLLVVEFRVDMFYW